MDIEPKLLNVEEPASGLYRPSVSRLCFGPDGDAGGQANADDDAGAGSGEANADLDFTDPDSLAGAVAAREKKQGAAADDDVDAGAGDQGQGEQGDEQEDLSWRDQPLHPAMAKKYGVATAGELADRYGASSTEAKRLSEESRAIAAERDEYRSAIQEVLRSRAKELERNTQQQPAAAAAKGRFGFASEAELQEAAKRDPEGTKWKVFFHQMKDNPEFKAMVQEIVQPSLKPVIEKHEQQEIQAQVQEENAFTERLAGQLTELQKDPRFAPGGPLAVALHKWYQENKEYEADRARKQPSYNMWERAKLEILSKIDTARADAGEKKLQNLRGKAPTAKPGTGGLTAPKSGNLKQSIERIAQEMRANGENIPDAVIHDMHDQLTEKLSFLA